MIPHVPTLIPRLPTLIPWVPTLAPYVPTLIPCIPTLIPRVLTLIPHVPTLILCVPIIPLIPLPDSPFRLLQIAYFFKERVQILSVRWPVNIETYLQIISYCKFWAYRFTYFILTLLNSTVTFTQLFVKMYMTLNSLKFKLEIMNMILKMITIIKEMSRKDKKKFSDVFSYNICHEWK